MVSTRSEQSFISTVPDTVAKSESTLYSHRRPRSHSFHFPSLHSSILHEIPKSLVAEPVYTGDEGSDTEPPPLQSTHGRHHSKQHKQKVKTLRAELSIARGVRVLMKNKASLDGGTMLSVVSGLEEQLAVSVNEKEPTRSAAYSTIGILESGFEQLKERKFRRGSVPPSVQHSGSLSDVEQHNHSDPGVLARVQHALERPEVAAAAVSAISFGAAALYQHSRRPAPSESPIQSHARISERESSTKQEGGRSNAPTSIPRRTLKSPLQSKC